ncbi:MAG TPA: TIGR03086 family metal-binding protein [Acidimicrobiales bacterium]|jgi:uncharacterized protein (TIGR03086 family)|nr:TIGR03086 family metal-binding protein [Acidimicrobiales bacterium]
MTATSDDVFDRGLDFFGGILDQAGDDRWDAASPCEGWTALDVVGHLCTSLDMGTSIMRGEPPTRPDVEHPRDVIDGDPKAFYAEAAAACRQALEGSDLDEVRDTPMGPRTVAEGLAFPAIDLYVHGWDLAQAVGAEAVIPDDVIAFAHQYLDPIPEDAMRGPNGAFGPEADVADDASASDRFVAWTGRTPV